MTEKASCSHAELITKVTALRASFDAFEKLMAERDRLYEERAKSQKEIVALAMAASEKAISKAETATERRLEGLNELKGMAENQAETFARKNEVKLTTDSLDERLKGLATIVNNQIAKGAGLNSAWGILLGAIGVVVSIASVLILVLHK